MGLGQGVIAANDRRPTPETAEKVQCKITMDWLTGCLCQYLLTNPPPRKIAGGKHHYMDSWHCLCTESICQGQVMDQVLAVMSTMFHQAGLGQPTTVAVVSRSWLTPALHVCMCMDRHQALPGTPPLLLLPLHKLTFAVSRDTCSFWSQCSRKLYLETVTYLAGSCT